MSSNWHLTIDLNTSNTLHLSNAHSHTYGSSASTGDVTGWHAHRQLADWSIHFPSPFVSNLCFLCEQAKTFHIALTTSDQVFLICPFCLVHLPPLSYNTWFNQYCLHVPHVQTTSPSPSWLVPTSNPNNSLSSAVFSLSLNINPHIRPIILFHSYLTLFHATLFVFALYFMFTYILSVLMWSVDFHSSSSKNTSFFIITITWQLVPSNQVQ